MEAESTGKLILFLFYDHLFFCMFQDHALIYNMAGGMCLGIDQVEENEIAKLVLCSKDLHNQWNLVR